MKLYHGSNMIIANVDLEKCRPYKDFGKGFYCTNVVYNSQIFEKVSDVETGLYKESPSFIYELFKDELKYGFIVQKEQ